MRFLPRTEVNAYYALDERCGRATPCEGPPALSLLLPEFCERRCDSSSGIHHLALAAVGNGGPVEAGVADVRREVGDRLSEEYEIVVRFLELPNFGLEGHDVEAALAGHSPPVGLLGAGQVSLRLSARGLRLTQSGFLGEQIGDRILDRCHGCLHVRQSIGRVGDLIGRSRVRRRLHGFDHARENGDLGSLAGKSRSLVCSEGHLGLLEVGESRFGDICRRHHVAEQVGARRGAAVGVGILRVAGGHECGEKREGCEDGLDGMHGGLLWPWVDFMMMRYSILAREVHEPYLFKIIA